MTLLKQILKHKKKSYFNSNSKGVKISFLFTYRVFGIKISIKSKFNFIILVIITISYIETLNYFFIIVYINNYRSNNYLHLIFTIIFYKQKFMVE
jgi:hypothetical protein